MSYDSDNTTNNTALLQVGDFLRRTAKERWLFAEELYIILSSSPSDLNFPLAMNPAQNPRNGELYLFDGKMGTFKNDGVQWVRKKGQDRIQETYQNIKVNFMDVILGIYTRQADKMSFKRRIYRLTDKTVARLLYLVHYRDTPDDERPEKPILDPLIVDQFNKLYVANVANVQSSSSLSGGQPGQNSAEQAPKEAISSSASRASPALNQADKKVPQEQKQQDQEQQPQDQEQRNFYQPSHPFSPYKLHQQEQRQYYPNSMSVGSAALTFNHQQHQHQQQSNGLSAVAHQGGSPPLPQVASGLYYPGTAGGVGSAAAGSDSGCGGAGIGDIGSCMYQQSLWQRQQQQQQQQLKRQLKINKQSAAQARLHAQQLKYQQKLFYQQQNSHHRAMLQQQRLLNRKSQTVRGQQHMQQQQQLYLHSLQFSMQQQPHQQQHQQLQVAVSQQPQVAGAAYDSGMQYDGSFQFDYSHSAAESQAAQVAPPTLNPGSGNHPGTAPAGPTATSDTADTAGTGYSEPTNPFFGSDWDAMDFEDIECLLDQDDILLPEEAPLVQQQSMIISSPGQQQEQKQVEVKAEGRAQTDSRAAGSSSEPHSHALIPAEQQQFPDAPFPPIMVADFAPMEDSRAQGGCKVLLCLAQEIPPFLLNQQLNVVFGLMSAAGNAGDAAPADDIKTNDSSASKGNTNSNNSSGSSHSSSSTSSSDEVTQSVPAELVTPSVLRFHTPAMQRNGLYMMWVCDGLNRIVTQPVNQLFEFRQQQPGDIARAVEGVGVDGDQQQPSGSNLGKRSSSSNSSYYATAAAAEQGASSGYESGGSFNSGISSGISSHVSDHLYGSHPQQQQQQQQQQQLHQQSLSFAPQPLVAGGLCGLPVPFGAVAPMGAPATAGGAGHAQGFSVNSGAGGGAGSGGGAAGAGLGSENVLVFDKENKIRIVERLGVVERLAQAQDDYFIANANTTAATVATDHPYSHSAGLAGSTTGGVEATVENGEGEAMQLQKDYGEGYTTAIQPHIASHQPEYDRTGTPNHPCFPVNSTGARPASAASDVGMSPVTVKVEPCVVPSIAAGEDIASGGDLDIKVKSEQHGESPSSRSSAADALATASAAATAAAAGENVEWLDDHQLSNLSTAELEVVMDRYIMIVVRQLVQLAAVDDDLKAEIDALDSSGFSLLHYCCLYNLNSLVPVLLARGADVDKRTGTGLTALHLAAGAGHFALVQVLVQSGATIAPSLDEYNSMPSATAYHSGYTEIYHFLLPIEAKCLGVDLATYTSSGWPYGINATAGIAAGQYDIKGQGQGVSHPSGRPAPHSAAQLPHHLQKPLSSSESGNSNPRYNSAYAAGAEGGKIMASGLQPGGGAGGGLGAGPTDYSGPAGIVGLSHGMKSMSTETQEAALSSKLVHDAFSSLSLTDKCALSLSMSNQGAGGSSLSELGSRMMLTGVGAGVQHYSNQYKRAANSASGASGGSADVGGPSTAAGYAGSDCSLTLAPDNPNSGQQQSSAPQQKDDIDSGAGSGAGGGAYAASNADDISEIQSVLSETDKESLDLAMSMMGDLELRLVESEVRTIQNNVRAWILRKNYVNLRDSARVLQSAWRERKRSTSNAALNAPMSTLSSLSSLSISNRAERVCIDNGTGTDPGAVAGAGGAGGSRKGVVLLRGQIRSHGNDGTGGGIQESSASIYGRKRAAGSKERDGEGGEGGKEYDERFETAAAGAHSDAECERSYRRRSDTTGKAVAFGAHSLHDDDNNDESAAGAAEHAAAEHGGGIGEVAPTAEDAAATLQAAARGMIARKSFSSVRKQTMASLVIQKSLVKWFVHSKSSATDDAPF